MLRHKIYLGIQILRNQKVTRNVFLGEHVSRVYLALVTGELLQHIGQRNSPSRDINKFTTYAI